MLHCWSNYNFHCIFKIDGPNISLMNYCKDRKKTFLFWSAGNSTLISKIARLKWFKISKFRAVTFFPWPKLTLRRLFYRCPVHVHNENSGGNCRFGWNKTSWINKTFLTLVNPVFFYRSSKRLSIGDRNPSLIAEKIILSRSLSIFIPAHGYFILSFSVPVCSCYSPRLLT